MSKKNTRGKNGLMTDNDGYRTSYTRIRAEIAALIVRTLSKLDPNADGGFTDVARSDWYFGAVGSARGGTA